ncbi:DUF6517 family protein [Natrinema halophilum]|uniref:Uncharacterized protein n=1 Tax=Natrinema halophilum TaxID=1699371 RepID=A0A7D5KS14_9EURY|nr:DUF6517 family protein [Natrinema halophilum]QLG49877.1 DUF6517 family protein [Natrinema halophilum]
MTITRRQLLAAGATTGMGSLAGCTGLLRDTLSSTPATVSGGALEESGYSKHAVDEVPIERTVGRFGIERTVEVRNWYAEYDRSVSLDELGLTRVQAAIVAALTTPQISFLGKTFNPVGEYSTADLVELIQSRYDRLEDVEYVDAESISILGTETTLARYDARARLLAQETTLDVYVQVSEPVAHGDDFVICVAAYPQVQGLETESDEVRTLLESLEHE